MLVRLSSGCRVLCDFQSITGAMSTINPPVELEDSGNQCRLEYIQNIATQADFDYPQVALPHLTDGSVNWCTLENAMRDFHFH